MTKSDEKGSASSSGGSLSSPELYTSPEHEHILELARELTRVSTRSGYASPFGDTSDPELDPSSPEFSSLKWSQNVHRLMSSESDQHPERSLGVSFRNLHAYGHSTGGSGYQLTTGNLMYATAQMVVATMNPKKEKVDILYGMDGVLQPGELLVVLGRPGSGCSTFLRTLSQQTYGFKVEDKTEFNYSGVSANDVSSRFRGDVTYSAESELHFPNLTVGDTLLFASRMKTPDNRINGVDRMTYARHMRDVVMATFGLTHTMNTRVGNDLIRGVSGGERKRVSIAELVLCQSVFQCWDNSTRGLDSATALEFVRSLRISSDTFKSTAAVAVYQASDEMYDMFDKVVVLYEGYQIYYGPVARARKFFYDMGWQPKPRQPTPDFLTSLSQPTEREARPGYEEKVPRTPQEFNERWRNSELYAELQQEIDDFNSNYPSGGEHAQKFQESADLRKDKRLPHKAAYTVSWHEQVKGLAWRGFKRMQGDPTMPSIQVFGNFAMGLIISSIFYNMQQVTGSFYHRTAVIFFALLFNAFSCMLEIFALYEARPIVQKHHQYALYHPAADAVGSITTEMPIKIATAISFNLVMYFIPNLRRSPGNFFFYLFANFLATLTMSHLFRTLGAMTKTLMEAMVPANLILLGLVLFTGFVIPTRNMHLWCRWINYVDPLAYIYESLLTNEFSNRLFKCTSLLPEGPAYSDVPMSQRICTVPGSKVGEMEVQGSDYIWQSFRYKQTHQWRNIGVTFGWMFFFLGTYLLAVWVNPGARTKGEVLIFPRRILNKMKKQWKAAGHEGAPTKQLVDGDTGSQDVALAASDDIFWWKDVCYDIKIKGEPRRLLNHVSGWVKPGTLTALMGASGAGKTTLLDTLANRVTMGVVTGHVFVNGTPRDNSFQRSTGYAMQQDLHLETSTVRESLVFAALMRQPWKDSYEEKIAYVDTVLKVLEMETYADAVVGVPGNGLNVEQRKRLTIGVELAAKPKLLLFLDEPTSGLDSQTAWSVCQLMKKLSNAGQAILCTIHQPSALLLQQFDRLLFLARGGRTVYFGPIGENAEELCGYFEKYGADPCPPDANPAEWMLHVIGAAPGSHANQDYADVWLWSEERQAMRDEINELIRRFDAKHENRNPDKEAHREFAAPLWYQFWRMLHRQWQMEWRQPMYLWSKFWLSVITCLFNGFAFFKADNTIQGMQNLMFSVFMFTTLQNALIYQYLPSFVAQRALYETRERPSKILSWKAFAPAVIIAEIPWQIIVGTFAFLCWYYPAGLYNNANFTGAMTERGGMTYFYVILYYIFSITMGQVCVAGMDDDDTSANIAMLLFTITLMFCGVLSTKEDMPGFWVFMYRVSPMTYWIGGMLALAIANAPVNCADYEFVRAPAVNGMNCGEYLGLYAKMGGGRVVNPASTTECNYCPIADTNIYLASLDIYYHQRWRNLGLFIVYIVVNMVGAVFIYWLARVPKSSSRVKLVPLEPLDQDEHQDEATADGHPAPEIVKTQKGKNAIEIHHELQARFGADKKHAYGADSTSSPLDNTSISESSISSVSD
ncbi:ABC transporter CDR4 [Wickerhamiella sorbophila]|uniref:ABC transporter CDR4 n=1 Tax=Wickerhamiella sorbophila TaxID=45607 RepID=A0A2T0FC98_9ASCO|nr:ABC transporter CDR4 [Wickerhamiella sorbophila]PRT52634.1 ABC transporter CDR4 [Wickerhamiella sorbophila]